MLDAIVLFPETSISSFICNLPAYAPKIKNKQIIIDKEDYRRINKLASESKEYLYQAISLKRLKNRGILKDIDYKTYYGVSKRRSNHNKINTIISETDDGTIDSLTIDGYENWISYARNDNKKLIYKSFDDESLRSFMMSENNAQIALNKIKNGGGDSALTTDYIERLFSKVMAADHIVERLNQGGISVPYAMDGKEYSDAVKILAENKLIGKNRFEFPNMMDLNSFSKIQILIDQIVSEMIPNSHSEKNSYVAGSCLSLLSTLDFKYIKEEFESLNENNIENFKANVNKILKIIKKIKFTEDFNYLIKKSNNLDYAAEYVNELFPKFPLKLLKDLFSWIIKDKNVFQYVPEIQGQYADSQILVGLSIFLDPIYEINNHTCYYNWYEFFTGIFSRVSLQDKIWADTQRDMNSWTKEKRWFDG